MKKKREVVRVCYYPVDGLFIHVFVTKLTGEGAQCTWTLPKQTLPCRCHLESSLHTLYFCLWRHVNVSKGLQGFRLDLGNSDYKISLWSTLNLLRHRLWLGSCLFWAWIHHWTLKKKEILGSKSILTFLHVGLRCTFKESNVTLRGCVKQKE